MAKLRVSKFLRERLPLLARFPYLRAPASYPVIPEDKRVLYPEFDDDFTELGKEAWPAFTDCDEAALREQNRYRRQQVTVLLGAATVTGLGGLQAVFPGERWPGVVLAAAGIVPAAIAQLTKERNPQAGYLDARVRAERLRGLTFQYLAMTGPYGGTPAERRVALQRAVLAIQEGNEPK